MLWGPGRLDKRFKDEVEEGASDWESFGILDAVRERGISGSRGRGGEKVIDQGGGRRRVVKDEEAKEERLTTVPEQLSEGVIRNTEAES